LRDWGIQEKESGARIEEAGETIGIVGLRAENIFIIIGFVALYVAFNPLFQHSKVFFNLNPKIRNWSKYGW
jgi:hypothetical protein